MLRFFPHEVHHFEPAVALLARVAGEVEAAAGAAPVCEDAGGLWEAQHVLLLWLSMLVLIPFDMAIVDSSLADAPPPPAAAAAAAGAADGGSGGDSGSGGSAGYPPIVGRLLAVCQRQLGTPGSCREMAAVLLARLVTRPDMDAALADLLGWACGVLSHPDDASLRAQFLVPGAALALAGIFKLGRRAALLPAAAAVFPPALGLLHSRAAAGNALSR